MKIIVIDNFPAFRCDKSCLVMKVENLIFFHLVEDYLSYLVERYDTRVAPILNRSRPYQV